MKVKALLAFVLALVLAGAVLSAALAVTRIDSGSATSVSGGSGTNWTAIGTGIGAGVAVLLVVAAAVYEARRGAWHMPHRPVHTH